eukprot:1148800-Pelagomonas_calceolata.AAC.8
MMQTMELPQESSYEVCCCGKWNGEGKGMNVANYTQLLEKRYLPDSRTTLRPQIAQRHDVQLQLGMTCSHTWHDVKRHRSAVQLQNESCASSRASPIDIPCLQNSDPTLVTSNARARILTASTLSRALRKACNVFGIAKILPQAQSAGLHKQTNKQGCVALKPCRVGVAHICTVLIGQASISST